MASAGEWQRDELFRKERHAQRDKNTRADEQAEHPAKKWSRIFVPRMLQEERLPGVSKHLHDERHHDSNLCRSGKQSDDVVARCIRGRNARGQHPRDLFAVEMLQEEQVDTIRERVTESAWNERQPEVQHLAPE